MNAKIKIQKSTSKYNIGIDAGATLWLSYSLHDVCAWQKAFTATGTGSIVADSARTLPGVKEAASSGQQNTFNSVPTLPN